MSEDTKSIGLIPQVVPKTLELGTNLAPNAKALLTLPALCDDFSALKFFFKLENSTLPIIDIKIFVA